MVTRKQKQAQALDAYQVVLACHGDKRAFRLLYQRWHPRLMRFAIRRLGTVEAARDVVQETALAMAKNLRRLKEPEQLGPWLFTILRRRIADHWQRSATGIRVDDTIDPDTLSRSSSVESDLSLAQALARLPAETRMILTGFYRDGLTVRDLAAGLGVPPGTVKSRLFTARERLRKIYHETEKGEYDAPL